MPKIITDKEKIEQLLSRGVVDCIVRENLKKRLMAGEKLRIKLGIDPTGSDLHLGHMVVIRKLRQFQELGHQIVIIVGSFTAKIGDPTGKTEMRKVLTDSDISRNFKNYARQAVKVLDISKTEIVYNGDWLEKLNFSEVINLAGIFTVQHMLNRDMFQTRLKRKMPISLHEFLYPLMVGYDSFAVRADVELGATEQLFNLLCGRPIQKALGQKEQDVMTMPILVGLDGKAKMSKSLNNYIGVDDEPFDMYGKIMSISDNLILQYFELCAAVSVDEIKEMERSIKGDKLNPRDLKMRLARDIVSIYHSKEEADKAEEKFKNVFQKKEIPDEIPVLEAGAREYNIVELLVELKLAASKGEARRLIQQKGVKIGGEVADSSEHSVKIGKDGVLVQKGKRHFVKVIYNKVN